MIMMRVMCDYLSLRGVGLYKAAQWQRHKVALYADRSPSRVASMLPLGKAQIFFF